MYVKLYKPFSYSLRVYSTYKLRPLTFRYATMYIATVRYIITSVLGRQAVTVGNTVYILINQSLHVFLQHTPRVSGAYHTSMYLSYTECSLLRKKYTNKKKN